MNEKTCEDCGNNRPTMKRPDGHTLCGACWEAHLAGVPGKKCTKCKGVIDAPELAPEEPELCANCDTERPIVSNVVDTDGVMHVTLGAMEAGAVVAIATVDKPVHVHAPAMLGAQELRATFEATLLRNFAILRAGWAEQAPRSALDDMEQMLKACAANLAQGFAGRVLP
jgi:hypothetical protein